MRASGLLIPVLLIHAPTDRWTDGQIDEQKKNLYCFLTWCKGLMVFYLCNVFRGHFRKQGENEAKTAINLTAKNRPYFTLRPNGHG